MGYIITILPIVEKNIWNSGIKKIISYVNEAFCKIDEKMVAFFLVEEQQTISS